MASNHNQNLYVWDMVQNRLPFLDGGSANNEQLVSDFTLEIMHEIEGCLRIEENGGAIGSEDDYSIAQRSLIADLVSCYILMAKALFETSGSAGTSNLGNGTPIQPNDKIITEVKAGSVTVKWSKFDLNKDAGLVTNTDQLLSIYKKSAFRRARALGCILDICEDCSLAVELMQDGAELPPFIVVNYGNNNGCGC